MRLTFRQKSLFLAAAFVAASLCAAPAMAQEEGIPVKWMTAVRGGIGMNSTEGIAGVMWQSPAMGPGKYLRFRPAVQAAFDKNNLAFAGILDLAAEFKIPGSKWTLIFGGGVAPGFGHASCDECTGNNFALTGHHMLFGFQLPGGLFIEIRAVAGWNHGMEILGGYYFKGKK